MKQLDKNVMLSLPKHFYRFVMSSGSTGPLLFGFAICSAGCAVNEGALSAPVQQEQLLNKPWEHWENANADNYIMPDLSFQADSTAVGSSRGDTIFYFTYALRGRFLILRDSQGRVDKCRILDLKPNTFMVDHLWMLKGPQTYHRRQFGP